ncbi:flagellin [Carboxydochorda subterranea]|uniref:Flagellin n=1 Tax=Carboxydichorda subterranea TaxID=3109565 RepID=A0ABZ1BU64_9FIRM|nr:flagellin [Limnochorda sp. L945t]WRP16191.1 flagellin [Limnochorda sp. L945t]
MRINQNVMALNAWRNLNQTSFSISKSLERLSSGLRINRAADDAAGLAISEKMRGQVRGLNMAVKNSQDAISLIQTAEGALNETHSILQRMRELAVQAASDTNTAEDRQHIQDEINQLVSEINDIATRTQFNTMTLLDGSFTNGVFHVGANQNETLSLAINSMDATSLAVNNLVVTVQASAESAIASIDNAIELVSTERSKLGAVQNRLDHKIANLNVSAENLTAAESRIRDADMAKEMMAFVRDQILLQSGTAMLAQANAVPQSVLQLLA